MKYAIEATGLVKRYGDTTALAGVDLAVPEGTLLGVLGPNGAGKTTAVRILATLLAPDEGRARVGGYDIASQPHQVRTQIGLTGQYAGIDDVLTGTENLLLIARLLGMSRAESRLRAQEMLERFELSDASGRAAKTYSGGMRRRLDLAASLLGRPRVLFLDEPTTGLDPQSRTRLWNIVRGLVSDGVTVLLTTQYLEEADQLADGIVVIDHGLVIAQGSPDALKSQVGGLVMTVSPVEARHEQLVAAVMAEVTGTTPALEDGRLTAGVQDAGLVPVLVRKLDELGVVANELSLAKASLDEVFLALTGQRATDHDNTHHHAADIGGKKAVAA